MSNGEECGCPKVPKPLPPRKSCKMIYAEYIRSFGTFEPYNRAKTANLPGGKGPTNGPNPVRAATQSNNTCGKIVSGSWNNSG